MRTGYRTIIAAVATAVLLLVLFKLLGRVNVAFESSAGDWADTEVLMKGRDYAMIAAGFARYQRSCGSHASLLRTTPMRVHHVFSWPSYAMDPKWQVPYAPAQIAQGYKRPSCAS
ncbi:MAG: hypothetical protein ACK4S6_02315 [Roseateles asaccharophilus]|uniref:hypothetical protein n=1 Tax=Roseateles asaccharophilus TaxID=582607 RepID=UPI00391A8BFD